LFTPLGQVWGLYPEQEWVELTDNEIEMIYAVTIKIRKKDIMPGEQKMFAKTICLLCNKDNPETFQIVCS
jgi:hypothetical protein